MQVDSLNDRRDFDSVRSAMRLLGYNADQVETVWKLLAAILHLVRLYHVPWPGEMGERERRGWGGRGEKEKEGVGMERREGEGEGKGIGRAGAGRSCLCTNPQDLSWELQSSQQSQTEQTCVSASLCLSSSFPLTFFSTLSVSLSWPFPSIRATSGSAREKKMS